MAEASIARATFEKIVVSLEHQRIVSYIEVLSATLLFYDVIINLPVEIPYMWRRKWTSLTVLYIVQRYLPFFDSTVLSLHHVFEANLSTSYCSLNHKILGWSFCTGIVLSEIVLTLRVWAVWKRSTTVAIGLVAFALGCWVPCCVFLAQFLSALEFAIPFPHHKGCFISGGSQILYVCWVLIMVYDTVTFAMILIPGVAVYRRGGRSDLLRTIYQDGRITPQIFQVACSFKYFYLGVIYYALIFLCSTINVIVIFALPVSVQYRPGIKKYTGRRRRSELTHFSISPTSSIF
ncbi:hypothetical protein L218DRAFT_945468 [Marasmius fiardii PR-910]|nr:hypothetical protein L218DRAFT_945468 [Marasmius fiardii PR-910]